MKKEITTEDDLMTVINILNGMGIEFWIDGGWGVDILAGKISREHRDIDIDFDSNYTKELLETLFKYGYITETDWFPARIELYSEKYGYLDIHPFILNKDGTAKQADLNGGWYEFEKDYFGYAVFNGVKIPCISVKGQKIFHTGYELREKDKHDLNILENIKIK